MRQLLYILSFCALGTQTPVTKTMSGACRKLTTCLTSAAVGSLSTIACTATYAKHLEDSYRDNPENIVAAQLEKIVPGEIQSTITQTQSQVILNKKRVEKSYAKIINPFSDLYFSDNRRNVISNILSYYLNREKHEAKIRKVASEAYKKEEEEIKNGNIVAYHGQMWWFHFATDIYKELHGLTEEAPIDNDYIPLRFSKKITPNDRLWMNYSLFSNTQIERSNSFYYFTNNYSMGLRSIEIKNIFQEFHLEDCYKKYKREIDELEELHSKATVNGNLLLLSFTPEQAEKWICRRDAFFTTPKKGVSQCIERIKKKALKNEETPSDNQKNITQDEVDCLTLTMDFLPEIIDPKTGPKVYAFNNADTNVMSRYKKKKRLLFERIKADRA